MKIDYLIVGQGLAGTWLAHVLQTIYHKKIMVVDQYRSSSASNVASGIINPITGRRLVKSWKMEELLPFAHKQYAFLEKKLKADSFYFPRPIIWLLSSIKELNEFSGRSMEIGYAPFIEQVRKGVLDPCLHPTKGYAEIKGGLQINVPTLITAFRQYLQQENLLIEASFNYTDLELIQNGIYWKNITAKTIIFCEGYHALHNPYFNWLPLTPAKGELLIIKAPQLPIKDKVIKGKVFILPLGNDHFWVGSNYDREDLSPVPTNKQQTNLMNRLDKVLNVPYEIVQHKAGIRPTTLRRRPFLGLHPQHPQLGIFNGLGTKGVSLAPFFAHQFGNFLENGGVLDSEVMIKQYWKEDEL